MDSKWLSTSTCIVVFLIWSSHVVHCQNSSFTVEDSGAVPDGKTDSKQAFLDAWKKACEANGGTLVIPKGSTYLVSDAEFAGPCNGETKVSLDGTLFAPLAPTPDIDYWIKFSKVDSLSIFGNGTLDGNGASFWKSPDQSKRPMKSLKLQSLTKTSIQGINSVNSKKFHMGLESCATVSIDNVHITAPGNSPNTDGVHVGDSDGVTITNSFIATGDDCVSLGPGATNINITSVTCGPGHGISIGSLGKSPTEKEVRFVTVTNCTLTGTQNGLRIKTFAASPPGSASDITFQHIVMNNVGNPIFIDQHYCPNHICPPGEDDGDELPIEGDTDPADSESNVLIQRVKFVDVRGSSSDQVGVNIGCSKTKPCKDIELSGVNLTFKGAPTTANCSSADVKFLGPIQVPPHC